MLLGIELEQIAADDTNVLSWSLMIPFDPCLKFERSAHPTAKYLDGGEASKKKKGACHSTLLMALSRIEGLISFH